MDRQKGKRQHRQTMRQTGIRSDKTKLQILYNYVVKCFKKEKNDFFMLVCPKQKWAIMVLPFVLILLLSP